MANWKNVTEHELTVYPMGPDQPKKVAPGGILTLSDEHDHIIGTHSGPGQFEKIEVEIKEKVEKPAAEKPAASKPAADTAKE